MNLTDLLTIIYDNQQAMLEKYPNMKPVILESHAKLVIAVDNKLKEKEGSKNVKFGGLKK